MKKLLTFLVLAVIAASPALAAPGPEMMPQIKDLKTGTGDEATAYSKVKVHYTGWLMDGTKFDSSVDRGTPFTFTLMAGQVIPGWDLGVEGMRVGGKRELVIPPELAYGKEGAPGAIPPNATLKFEVELLGVTPPGFTNVGNGELKDLLARGVPLVDIRLPEEWKETGIVEGSKMITAIDGNGRLLRSFVDGLQGLAGQDDEVILICRTGNRTAAVSNFLADRLGYKKIYNVTDGITQWIKDGNAVVKP